MARAVSNVRSLLTQSGLDGWNSIPAVSKLRAWFDQRGLFICMAAEADYVWGTGLTEQQRLLKQIEL
jgi:hypothetical protein